jgi:hypothetical protein
MQKNKNNGQEAIEFILISSLVFLGCIFTVMLLGSKIGNFFQNDSAVITAQQNKIAVISASDPVKYEPDYVTEIPYETENLAGLPVNIYDDGSAAFNYKGQTVQLSSDLVQAANRAMEASGSSGGLEEIVADIMYMSDKLDVPPNELDVWLGTSEHHFDVKRGGQWVNSNYKNRIKGVADVNMIAIKHDQDILIVNKGQNQLDGTYGIHHQGLKLRIEGSITSDNTFNASELTGQSNMHVFSGGSYQSSVEITDGTMIFKQGNINMNHEIYEERGSSTGIKSEIYPTGWLELKFENPNFQFSLD